jgi:hypothetical protein
LWSLKLVLNLVYENEIFVLIDENINSMPISESGQLANNEMDLLAGSKFLIQMELTK